MIWPARYASFAKGGPKDGRGVTLFEMVVVIVIIALMSAVAIPRMANAIRRQRLDMASRRLMADLQLVRGQAIRDRVNYSLSINGQSYSVPQAVRPSPGNTVTLDVTPYEGVRLRGTSYNGPAGGLVTIQFSPLGLPQAGGSITLEAGKEPARLDISAATGRVTRVLGEAR